MARPATRSNGLLALGLVASALLAGCGGGGPATLATADLGLPAGPPTPLATAELDTSPDGGIYRNPDRVAVVMTAHADLATLAGRLGRDADGWAQLRQLGAFTVIALQLRNDGRAGSEPALNDLQVASDFAPADAASGPLRHFYHPTYPLAALSPRPLVDGCTVHLDPGDAATVLLVYPPLRSAPTLLWGRYNSFAVALPSHGGGAGDLGDSLHAAVCAPPPPPQGQAAGR